MSDWTDSEEYKREQLEKQWKKEYEEKLQNEAVAEALQYDGRASRFTEYGVAIAPDGTVDLTTTMAQVRSLLSSAGKDISGINDTAIENFARDLVALQRTHADYMANMLELTEKAPEIDWTERYGVLSQQARADYASESSGKVGRMDTIITSPLLDEQDPVTTNNILGGS